MTKEELIAFMDWYKMGIPITSGMTSKQLVNAYLGKNNPVMRVCDDYRKCKVKCKYREIYQKKHLLRG